MPAFRMCGGIVFQSLGAELLKAQAPTVENGGLTRRPHWRSGRSGRLHRLGEGQRGRWVPGCGWGVNMELHREPVWIGVMCSVDLVQQSSGPVEVLLVSLGGRFLTRAVSVLCLERKP